MVFPLPSFPWQDAQCWLQFAAASAATPMPVDAMMVAAKTYIFRFINYWLCQWRSNIDDSELRSETDLFLERSNVGNKRFDFAIAQLAAEGFHRRFAVLLDSVFDCRGGLRIGEGCLLLRIC